MSETCKTRLCGDPAGAAGSIRPDQLATAKEMIKAVMESLDITPEASKRFAIHYKDQNCAQSWPFDHVKDDDLPGFCGQDICVHLQSKNAHRRRVEDMRATKTANVDVDITFRRAQVVLDAVTVGLPASTRIRDLSQVVQGYLVTYLNRTDDEVLSDAVESGRKWIEYTCGFGSADMHAELLSADDPVEELNIDTLSDVFRNPQRQNNVLRLVVDVEANRAAPFQALQQAVTPKIVLSDWEVYRLGTAEDHADGDNEDEVEKSDVLTIKVCKALIAYCNKGDSAKHNSLKICTIPSFDFGEFCIGDSNTNMKGEFEAADPKTNERYTYLHPFEKYSGKKSSYKALKDAIKEFAQAGDQPPVGSGVPFLPSYTCNDYNLCRDPVTEPDDKVASGTKVNFAVRCVDQQGYNIVFPRDICFTLPCKTNAKTIRRAIYKVFRGKGGTSTSPAARSPSKLFTAAFQGKWTLALFAMPQEPGEMKLYSFAKAGDDTGEYTVTSLLNRDLVATGDCRLYFEAHVVPVKTAIKWVVTGNWYESDPDGEDEEEDEEGDGEPGVGLQAQGKKRKDGKGKPGTGPEAKTASRTGKTANKSRKDTARSANADERDTEGLGRRIASIDASDTSRLQGRERLGEPKSAQEDISRRASTRTTAGAGGQRGWSAKPLTRSKVGPPPPSSPSSEEDEPATRNWTNSFRVPNPSAGER
ncbi:hypothetical protein LTR85_009179 [Meristemomyces frigidus]|nr:hypothetical protein LTR85_009179 [Meristemomyces frigidus]